MMRVVYKTGVRVVDSAFAVHDFPSTAFEVRDNGTLVLSGVDRMTFAPGAWVCASYILSETDPAESKREGSPE